MISYIDGNPSSDLVRLQSVQKAVAGLLIDFCESHGWRPFLVCGSALGAVRGGDTIPWDDDIDVGMLREDYEKFLEAYQKDPIPGLHLQCWRTESGYPLAFAKLRVVGASIEENAFAGMNFSRGIYIDVFPFDRLPASTIIRRIQHVLLIVINIIVMSFNTTRHNTSSSWIGRRVREAAHAIRPIMPVNRLIHVREWLNNPPSVGRASLRVCFEMYGIRWARRSYVEESILLPSRLMRFGDREMPIPGQYDEYLKGIFGAYMTLPSEDERRPLHVLSVDFGEACPFG